MTIDAKRDLPLQFLPSVGVFSPFVRELVFDFSLSVKNTVVTPFVGKLDALSPFY